MNERPRLRQRVGNESLATPAAARLGFAVADPVLGMAGGMRTIALTMTAGAESFQAFWHALGLGADEAGSAARAAWQAAFEVWATGPDGWVPLLVQEVVLCHATASVCWTLLLREDQPALVGYDAAPHGPGFATPWPVVRFSLQPSPPAAYRAAYRAAVALQPTAVHLAVGVQDMSALELANQAGDLSSHAPFSPFGASGQARDYLLLGAPELAYKKQVHRVQVRLSWQHLPPAPGNFAAYYAGYGQALADESFQVEAAHRAGGAWCPTAAQPLFRREGSGGLALNTVVHFGTGTSFDPDPIGLPMRLRLTAPACGFGSALYPRAVADAVRWNSQAGGPAPSLPPTGAPLSAATAGGPACPPLHEALAPAAFDRRPLPQAPFVPMVQQAALSYRAEAVLHLGQSPPPAGSEGRFYHLNAHFITAPTGVGPLLPITDAEEGEQINSPFL